MHHIGWQLNFCVGCLMERCYFQSPSFVSSAVNCKLCACVYKVKSPGSWMGRHAGSRRRRQCHSPGACRQLGWRFHLHGVISWSTFSWSQVTFPTTSGLALLGFFHQEKLNPKNSLPWIKKIKHCLLKELTCKVEWTSVSTLLCEIIIIEGVIFFVCFK